MKLFFWKIIALFSVILGSLGPQVAAGSPVFESTAETTVVRVEPLPVVMANQDTEVLLAQTTTTECEGSSFQLGRFDLILWHPCDMALALGSVVSAEVMVTNQQPEWPELSVTGDPKHNLSSDYTPWSSTETVSATILNGPTTGLPERSNGTIIRQIETSVIVRIKSDFGLDQSQQNIVMRC